MPYFMNIGHNWAAEVQSHGVYQWRISPGTVTTPIGESALPRSQLGKSAGKPSATMWSRAARPPASPTLFAMCVYGFAFLSTRVRPSVRPAAALFSQRIPRRLRCTAAFYTAQFFYPVIFIIHKAVVLRLITGELLHYGRSRAHIKRR